MRRGSADITIVEEDRSSIKTYFRSKKLSFITNFQGKSRKKTCDRKDSLNSDQKEALRCLDEIIETEKIDNDNVENILTVTPVPKDIVTNEEPIEEAENYRTSVTNLLGNIKYDTIKGFDSFMLY